MIKRHSYKLFSNFYLVFSFGLLFASCNFSSKQSEAVVLESKQNDEIVLESTKWGLKFMTTCVDTLHLMNDGELAYYVCGIGSKYYGTYKVIDQKYISAKIFASKPNGSELGDAISRWEFTIINKNEIYLVKMVDSHKDFLYLNQYIPNTNNRILYQKIQKNYEIVSFKETRLRDKKVDKKR